MVTGRMNYDFRGSKAIESVMEFKYVDVLYKSKLNKKAIDVE